MGSRKATANTSTTNEYVQNVDSSKNFALNDNDDGQLAIGENITINQSAEGAFGFGKDVLKEGFNFGSDALDFAKKAQENANKNQKAIIDEFSANAGDAIDQVSAGFAAAQKESTERISDKVINAAIIAGVGYAATKIFGGKK